MQTIIYISGQISGNFKLKSAIETSNSETKKAMFNAFEIVFQTKKEAKKALWEGFKYLKRNDCEASYSKFGLLFYDASKAEILSTH